MIELLAGVSGAGLLATIGSTIYFAVKHARAVEHAANVLVAQAHVEGELTRSEYQVDALTKQLDLAERRADALQEVLNESAPNADLPPDAVFDRLRRLAGQTATRFSADSGHAVVPEAAATPASPVADVLAGLATVR